MRESVTYQTEPEFFDATSGALHELLTEFRTNAQSEREKGNSFEFLVQDYLRTEPAYRELYGNRVWLWQEWRNEAAKRGLRTDITGDTGIDLVAETNSGELHAFQAKFYDNDSTLSLTDLSTFLAAVGHTHYAQGFIITTATRFTHNLRPTLQQQKTPISLITYFDLEKSIIDWSQYKSGKTPVIKPRKTPRPHQQNACASVLEGFQHADRGKLIMACGTGKTYTALQIAETLLPSGGSVLFLVPSLALLSQTLTEWTQDSTIPLRSFAVCSDDKVGKQSDPTDPYMLVHELQYPATTNATRLAEKIAGLSHASNTSDAPHITVVFATYHSIAVVSEAQHLHGLPDFDLIICDEAHRTTGAAYEGEDESHFVKVHDAEYIRGVKRLYMTATPRIYANIAKVKAEQNSIVLYSMDDEEAFGKVFHTLTFSEAVKRGLLVDYKVIVLAVEETAVSRRIQSLLADENNQLKVDDAAKIVGCWKALAKQNLHTDLSDDTRFMQRAVAFCQVIERSSRGKSHRVASKEIATMFQAVVRAYQDSAEEKESAEASQAFRCEVHHVDGSMNAAEKEEHLAWLKQAPPEHACRILSNVRCLSEGVDVPALDAVLFLSPRNSQVDVVQSVGRVMRLAPNKKRGYVILPVVIPAGKEPHEALNDNETYRVVWQVLNALRSHDDRFDAMINKMELIGADHTKMEVIAITDQLPSPKPTPQTASAQETGRGEFTLGNPETKPQPTQIQGELEFEIGDLERAIYAKLVQKVGNRHHWEDWATDIAKIAKTHIDRIQGILQNPQNTRERQTFTAFAEELRDDLNDAITDDDIIEMLAQHLITKPVFDALFEGYDFARHNPISRAMQGILDALQEHRLDKETDTLQTFYDSVKLRAQGIDNADAKQRIIVELYDKFFRNAFPRATERLGIVYTPVEVVDFILHSVNDILQSEFHATLSDRNVHIIDPFTGTGTFITRLLTSGMIHPDRLTHKYRHELHANEIVLLAYYIAAINIEATYHGLTAIPETTVTPGTADAPVGSSNSSTNHLKNQTAYEPFPGICLTDTFQLYEKEDLISKLLVDNSDRRSKQKKLDIRVIVANPPYSIGQTSQNDNAANVAYQDLDKRIEITYADKSKATSVKGLYDSYIRAIRWASDRLGESGIIGYVTNAGFLEANSADGLRQCLAEEFSSIYVFHLRGNQRTSGELSRKEGGKIFGSGSRAPIAITILVKNPKAKKHGQIYWHDIGDYLTREEKLEIIKDFHSLNGITQSKGWKTITPDEHGDWIDQRNDDFASYIVIGNKKNEEVHIFDNFSQGILSSRDSWCYNFSKINIEYNITNTTSFYNNELQRFHRENHDLSRSEQSRIAKDFIDNDSTKISWSSSLIMSLQREQLAVFQKEKITLAHYRPFTKMWMYYDSLFNHRLSQMPQILSPMHLDNLVICVTGLGENTGFSTLISNLPPNFHFIAGSQCFPLYLYDEASDAETVEDSPQGDLFERKSSGTDTDSTTGHTRRDAITDEGLAHFTEYYPGESITKEDLFYYIYGILHSPDYRERFANNLTKELPRIPRVKTAEAFRAFSQAGRDLAKLHLNYETLPPHAGVTLQTKKATLTATDYRVTKMKHPKIKDPETGKRIDDLTRIIYNDQITLTGIPESAYRYIVNGKSAIAWILDRQQIKTDKKSNITNDPNHWATETMNNPKYPLTLLQSIITLSQKTMKIVDNLPKLDI